MNNCDVCNNFALLEKATCDEKSFRWSVVKTLCYITTLLTAQEEVEVEEPITNILAQVVKTNVQVQADYTTYATVGLINSTKKLNAIRIANDTNSNLDFSFNSGTTTAFTVLAKSTYQEKLNLTLSEMTSLQMKRSTGQSASVGSVYIEGRYNS